MRGSGNGDQSLSDTHLEKNSLYQRWRTILDSKDNIHEYWRNPTEENVPVRYLSRRGKIRSRYLKNVFVRHFPFEATITELGCNVGRNLWHLWKHGYHRLTGIEINQSAVDLMADKFPKMSPAIMVGSIEDCILNLPRQDVIFTMAVLMHIHPDSDWIFKEMSARADNLVMIEDERAKGPRAAVRNYRGIFEAIGMQQIEEFGNIPGLNQKYVGRVFAWTEETNRM